MTICAIPEGPEGLKRTGLLPQLLWARRWQSSSDAASQEEGFTWGGPLRPCDADAAGAKVSAHATLTARPLRHRPTARESRSTYPLVRRPAPCPSPNVPATLKCGSGARCWLLDDLGERALSPICRKGCGRAMPPSWRPLQSPRAGWNTLPALETFSAARLIP